MHAMSDGFVVQELGVSREGINIETLVNQPISVRKTSSAPIKNVDRAGALMSLKKTFKQTTRLQNDRTFSQSQRK
jgi:hypothetical protein